MEVVSIFLNRILLAGKKKRVASLHLSAGQVPIVRIHNKLEELEGEDKVENDLLMGIIKSILLEDELAVLGEKKEVVISRDLAGELRFRINIFKQKSSYAISFYYVNKKVKTIKEIKLPDIISRIINQRSGLLVVAGSYGAGKTTTCGALVEEINTRRGGHIVTIEDPIENIFVRQKSLIEQRQIGRDVRTFDDALKYCLRDDVDTVYLSEIRNNFTHAFPLLVELASGNSLVILEINAPSSIQVIEKLINALESKYNEEAARFMLADTLLAVVVQRSFFKKSTGKAMAYEVMINNSAIQSLIREGRFFQLDNIIQTSRKEGMISMSKSIDDLIDSGIINEEDI